jgi:C-terminal peptidase prc
VSATWPSGRCPRARPSSSARRSAASSAPAPPAWCSTCAATRAGCSTRPSPSRRSFLAEGVVVSIEGAHEPQRVFAAEPRGPASTLPLVVVVDRDTASAAEVVAGALRDNGRATVVGENTFGKALVQSIEPLPNGAALKLTTARYLTPTGTDISSGGLKPHATAVDEPATAEDEAVARALELVP